MDAGDVYEGGGGENRRFGGQRRECVVDVVAGIGVNVDGVHGDVWYAGHEGCVVPRCDACVAAENEMDRWVEVPEGFSPLQGFFGVVFFGHLADLPWSP